MLRNPAYLPAVTDTRQEVVIRRQPDGSWTAHPQPPLPATSSFVTRGWGEVAELRQAHDAVDRFPDSADYEAFVEQFGPAPS